jgi:hypothetical protein
MEGNRQLQTRTKSIPVLKSQRLCAIHIFKIKSYLEEELDILNILKLDKLERNHRTIQLTRGENNILQFEFIIGTLYNNKKRENGLRKTVAETGSSRTKKYRYITN